jgi:hypothetical protein
VPASSVESAATADCASVEPTSVEPTVTVESALRPTAYSVTPETCIAMKSGIATDALRPVESSISVEALESIATTKSLATMEPCRTLEVSAALETVESVTAPETGAAVKVPATEVLPPASAHTPISPPAAVMKVPPAVAVEVQPSRIVKRKTAAVEGRAVETSEPWACADENAAVKPFRPVVPIRCTGVRCIRIIAIRANRWPTSVRRANAHNGWAHANPDGHANARASRPRRRSSERHHQPHDCRVL